MKRISIAIAASIAVFANTFALLHAWRNRAEQFTSDITLTERELGPAYGSIEDDSGFTLDLKWNTRQPYDRGVKPWLDATKLAELGFDTSVPPTDKSASEFYQRQQPRRAYVALEFNGPAWQAWQDYEESRAQTQPIFRKNLESTRNAETRLVAIDCGTNAERLRSLHPERQSVIIVPATIRIWVEGAGNNMPGNQPEPRILGNIEEIPSSIHVPLPFGEEFKRQPKILGTKYRVHLRYGASLEPWIVSVEFTPTS